MKWGVFYTLSVVLTQQPETGRPILQILINQKRDSNFKQLSSKEFSVEIFDLSGNSIKNKGRERGNFAGFSRGGNEITRFITYDITATSLEAVSKVRVHFANETREFVMNSATEKS